MQTEPERGAPAEPASAPPPSHAPPPNAFAEVRFYALTVVGLALFPFALHLVGGYSGLATQVLIVGIAAIGFNLLLGYAGLLSYGHAAFYGLGSYIAALLILRVFHQSANLWLVMAISVVSVTAISLAIGSLVVRLYGIYFALLTVAFAQMFYFVVFQWRDVTHGDDGLQAVAAPKLALGPLGTYDLTSPLPGLALGPFGDLSDLKLWYVFIAVIAILVIAFVRTLLASQFGEVLAAIRENEERSTFVGYNPALYKLAAFVLSAALGALSGALHAMYENSTAIDTLEIGQSGNFVIYTVVGGVQTLFGPLVGTAVVMYLQNVISAKTEAWRLIEGLVFVGVIVFLPGGLLGTFRKSRFSVPRTLRTK